MGNIFANAIRETSNSRIVSVASSNKDRINNFLNKYNYKNVNAYDNYDEIVKDKNINAIYIATLNNTHFELIKKCSENNKNILCEKPFTLNYDEAKIAANYISKHNVNFYAAFAY